jgi:hypothetical protein
MLAQLAVVDRAAPEKHAWNGAAEIYVAANGARVDVLAPIRGEGLRVRSIARAREPELFALLAAIAAQKSAPRSIPEERVRARLAAIGLLVPAGAIPREARFSCSFREAKPRGRAPRGPLVVSPSLRYEDTPSPPAETRAPRPTIDVREGPLPRPEVSPLTDGVPWATVDHASAALATPYAIAAGDRALFRALSPGAEPPADLDRPTLTALLAAGILVDPLAAARRRRAWERARDEARAALARDRWAIASDLLHPAHLAAIRRYYRDLVAEGHVPFGDAQVSRRYAAHDEPLARLLLRGLAAHVSALAGAPMRPTYAYFASYREGAVLAPHKDREECELSLSLLVDYVPEPAGASPWPIFLGSPSRPTRVDLRLGDALVYRGAELTHFRRALPRGHASTSLFLHYVRENR